VAAYVSWYTPLGKYTYALPTVARTEQPKARGRSRPERTRLYVRIGDDRERRDATVIGTVTLSRS
jgi:hypothetical protein